jgi:predicted small lipoprotein YifL
MLNLPENKGLNVKRCVMVAHIVAMICILSGCGVRGALALPVPPSPLPRPTAPEPVLPASATQISSLTFIH